LVNLSSHGKPVAGREECSLILKTVIILLWKNDSMDMGCFEGVSCSCEISSSHGGVYDVQNCLLGCTAMKAVRTSEMSVDNYFTREYTPEDNSEHELFLLCESASCFVWCHSHIIYFL
jgi:hypothetical protein